MDWPDKLLPSPTINFSFEEEPSVISNRMESGALRQRQRFVGSLRAFNATIIVSSLQLGIFQAFYEQAIYNGAGRFNIALPLPGFNTLIPVEVMMQNGSRPTEAKAGNEKWEVSFTLVSDTVQRIVENLYVMLAEFELAELAPFATFGEQLYDTLDNLNMN